MSVFNPTELTEATRSLEVQLINQQFCVWIKELVHVLRLRSRHSQHTATHVLTPTVTLSYIFVM